MVEAQITGIEKKMAKNGKTFFSVKCSNGRAYNCFDGSVHEGLHGKMVSFTETSTDRAGNTYYNMTKVTPLSDQPGGGSSDASTQPIPASFMGGYCQKTALELTLEFLKQGTPPEVQVAIEDDVIRRYWKFKKGFSEDPDTFEQEPI